MKQFYIKYRLEEQSKEQGVCLYAENKQNAYEIAAFVVIPRRNNGKHPYSAWVYSATQKNGTIKYFNTFEGKPY